MHQLYTTLHQSYLGAGASGYYWPMNQGFAYYTHVLELISGATGTISTPLNNTNYTMSPGDSALSFNGAITAGRTGDYLTITANVPTTSWTVSALFNTNTLTGYQDILYKNSCLVLRLYGNQVQVYAFNTGWVSGAFGSLQANTWYRVVATWDGATIRVYLNGALIGSFAFTGQVNNANTTYLGGVPSLGEWFNGSIGHVFLVSGAMTAADIATIYQAVSSTPHVQVSATGIVDTTSQPIRLESHYDHVVQTAQDWGLQVTVEPMQLESGEFPGRIRPLTRVGRDTEYVVGSPQVRRATAHDIQDAITAEDVCDVIASDAQGLADPTGTAQLTAEVFNFAQMLGVVTGGQAQQLHPWLSEEYDQSNNISVLELLVQRLSSLLALRGGPWESVTMGHGPVRQMLDTFPLTGNIAEFFWTPGDGVRLNFPELGVVDRSPRQILGVQWPITPAGLGGPSISLRQRPRSFAQMIRGVQKQILSGQRSYQTQMVTVSGTLGAVNDSAVPDSYTRVSLPQNLANVITATFIVQVKTDASSWTIEVNSVSTGVVITTTGRYDLTQFLARAGTDLRMYARLISGGTGLCDYSLGLLVRT